MGARGLLRTVAGGGLRFECPGCRSSHLVWVGDGPGPRWGFNGDHDRPTFTPSVLVRYDGPDARIDGAPPAVCHSFVTDGRIQFLDDCTHALAGQTVDLKPCATCRGEKWVDDKNWAPAYPDVPWERTPRDGRIPCARCNFAGWDEPDGAITSDEGE